MAVTMTVRPSNSGREFIARTSGVLRSSSVWYLSASARQASAPKNLMSGQNRRSFGIAERWYLSTEKPTDTKPDSSNAWPR